jgi:hypothetical protein
MKNQDENLKEFPDRDTLLPVGVWPFYTAWPFPTSLVNKPLNDTPAKIDGLKDAQEAPF